MRMPLLARDNRPGGPVTRCAVHRVRSVVRDRRLVITIGCAAAAFAAFSLALVMPWGPRMVDLTVYRAAARYILTGTDPYLVKGPDGLPFTYPVFAAVVFVPLALLPALTARLVITLASLVALVLICHISIRQVVP